MARRPVSVVVDNRVRLSCREVGPDVVSALRSGFEHKNPEHGMKEAIGISTYGVPRSLATWALDGDELSLPRGAMPLLRKILYEHEVSYRAVDARVEGSPSPSFPRYVGRPLRPFQREGLARIVEREQGIVRAPTGSGKTTLAFAAVGEVGLNAIVILPTKGLFTQWTQRAESELGLRRDQLGMIGDGKRRVRPVTIAMQRSLWNIPEGDEIYDYFGHVIVDEAQLAAARTVQETIDRFKARFRIAVSADERRKDRKEFLTHDLFGDVIYEISRDAVEETGAIVDVVVRVIPTEHKAPWYGVPEEEDEEDEREGVDFKRLLDGMTADRARDDLALRFIHEEVRSGEQAIMLTARREHVRALDRFFVEHQIPSGYFLGDQESGDAAEFERTRLGILSGGVRVGIGTYSALGYGIDLPAVSVGAAVTPISSNPQQTNQVRGRLCRASEGKTHGRFYVLLDHHVYPRHIDVLIRHNRNVVVWDRGSWTDARAWRKRQRRAAR